MVLTQATIEAMTDEQFADLWRLADAEAWRRIYATKPGQQPGFIKVIEGLRPMGTKKAGITSQKGSNHAPE